MYVSPGFGRGQPAYLYWSTALSLLLSGQSGCLTHVLASISAFPSAPGFAALPCNLSLKTSLTALYVSILSVSPEAIFPYRLPRGSSCIQISMQCPPGYCGTLGKSVLKGASHMLASGKTLWVLGLHWRAASGQPHGDFLLVEGTGVALWALECPRKQFLAASCVLDTWGHNVEDCLVLVLHFKHPESGHMGTGCSLLSACKGPLGTYWL